MFNKKLVFIAFLTLLIGFKFSSTALAEQSQKLNSTSICFDGYYYNYPEFKIGFDSKNKTFKVTDRKSRYYLNSSLKYYRFCSIVILDKNDKIKLVVDLNGYDTGTSDKLDKLNNFKFQYGDTIRMWHNNFNHLRIEGTLNNYTGKVNEGFQNIENKDSLINIKITKEGLRYSSSFVSKVENNTINFTARPPLGGNAPDNAINFKLRFDPYVQELYVTDRKDKFFNPSRGNEECISIKLSTKEGVEKLHIKLNGYDSGTSKKLDILYGTKFNYGDVISIWRDDSMDNTISEKVLNAQSDYSKGIKKTNNSIDLIISELGLVDALVPLWRDEEKVPLENNIINFSSNTPNTNTLDLHNLENTVFRIGFDTTNKKLLIHNKSDLPLSDLKSDLDLVSIKLLNSMGLTKASANLTSSDNGFSNKIHPLEESKFEYGDFLLLDLYAPSLHYILGNILGNTIDYSQGITCGRLFCSLKFEITKNGLKYIPLPPPVIKGADNISIYMNSNFAYTNGVTATDSAGKDITSNIEIIGKVDTSKPGVYPIYYSVVDSLNEKTTILRKVKVIESKLFENVISIYSKRIFSTPVKPLNRETKLSFQIIFDEITNKLQIKPLSKAPLNNFMTNDNYFKLTIKDKLKKEKISLQLNNLDTAFSPKLNVLNNFSYEIGDTLSIWHFSPSELMINGTIINAKEDYSDGVQNKDNLYKTDFVITENGLQAVSLTPPTPFRDVENIEKEYEKNKKYFKSYVIRKNSFTILKK